MRAAPNPAALAALAPLVVLAALGVALPAGAAPSGTGPAPIAQAPQALTDEAPPAPPAAGEAATAPRPEASSRGPEEPATPPVQTGAIVASPPHRNRWFLLPVVFYLPETRLGFGATAGIHVDVKDAPRPASLFAAAVYTLEQQGTVDLAGDLTLPSGTYFNARARAVYYPDQYFGIGPSSPSSAREDFTRASVELVATGEHPVPRAHGLRAGLRVDLRAEDIRDKEPGGALAGGAVTGSSGFSAISAGPSVTWDTRDNVFWTRSGSLAQLWYVYAPPGLGRHEEYGRGVLEVRHFFPLPRGRALGVDAYTEQANGDPPFTLLPKLGSTRFMRGIREGRYRDRVEWALQSELRTPVWGRVSAVAFAAVGDVAPRWSDVTLDTAKVTGGVGLRFRLTDQGANLRVDVAAGESGLQLYVLVLEAM